MTLYCSECIKLVSAVPEEIRDLVHKVYVCPTCRKPLHTELIPYKESGDEQVEIA